MAQTKRKPAARNPRGAAALEDNLRSALTDSRRRYKDLVEISSDFVWETDATGAFVFVSKEGALGYSARKLIGKPAAGLLADSEDKASSPFRARRPVDRTEIWCRTANDELARLECSVRPLTDKAGRFVGARGVARDVTDERALEEKVARARTRERLYNFVLKAIWDKVEPKEMLPAATEAIARAFSAAAVGLWRHDPEEGWVRFVGAGDEAKDRKAAKLPDREKEAAEPFEFTLASARTFTATTGTAKGEQAVLTVVRDGNAPVFDEDEAQVLSELAFQVGIAMAHAAQHEALERLSNLDGLSGLLVRRAFVGKLEPRLKQTGALLYVDLDNFKPVNDTLGHAAGDQVIRLVANQVRDAAGDEGLAARIGGDEFALWIDGANAGKAKRIARALRRASKELKNFSASRERPLGYSIGIAINAPASGEGLDGLIGRADAAMYAVKRAGKGGIELAPPYGAGGVQDPDRG